MDLLDIASNINKTHQGRPQRSRGAQYFSEGRISARAGHFKLFSGAHLDARGVPAFLPSFLIWIKSRHVSKNRHLNKHEYLLCTSENMADVDVLLITNNRQEILLVKALHKI